MKQKIVISCDSTADLSSELLEKYNIEGFPLMIVKDDETLRDGIDIYHQDIFDYKEKTGKLLKTSAPNIAECQKYIESLKEKYGEDAAIIHFDISSEMSSTFSNFYGLRDEYSNIYPIDSRNLSTGIGLLVLKAAELRDEGLSAQEIYDEIIATIERVDASFVLNTLEYLHKGGRCSGVAALGANLLKLKPCIEVRGGEMDVGKKYRGKLNDVLKTYVEDMLHDPDDIELDRIFVTHTVTPENMDIVYSITEQLKSTLPFKEVLITRAGCSVSVHCGPNTLGVLFIRKTKVVK